MKTYLSCALFCLSFSAIPAHATSIELGGFLKANARYVDGNIAFQDSWAGGGQVVPSAKRTQFSAQESRFNVRLNHEQILGFAEIDFVGSAQGNPIISNSYAPRLRHAFIQYQGFTAGQTWSTLVNTSSFAETADLGGPLVGQAMVRQAQFRFSTTHWQFALENPYTYGTTRPDNQGQTQWIDTSNDYLPDTIIRYNQTGDWGNVTVSALIRYLDPDGSRQWGGGLSVGAKLFTLGRDDLRLQLHYGNLGRYVGTNAARDIIEGEIETSLSGMFAYRHFWTERSRSTLFFGRTTTQVEQTDRHHWGINLFTDLTPALSVGIELGRYEIEDATRDAAVPRPRGASNYAQLSMQLSL
ncbi:porin [Shewanella insulae]|uniref:porin n=1 Tax=Shewanella insulae TaxID=2681496 RepID=UPI001EFEB86E|nr:porin [Shewanella insulae]MCG9740095.1 porin [Shewanella insulae]